MSPACVRETNTTKAAGHPRWEPILPEPLLSAARSAILDVAAEFTRQWREPSNASLNGELALLYAYLEMAEPGAEWRELSIQHLNLAAAQASDSPPSGVALFGGLSGLGWMIQHVCKALAGDEEEDPVADIDRILLRRLRAAHWSEPYDLVSGLAGIGVYFLERLPRPSAQEGLELVLGHLEECSEESWGGITWFTPPAHVPSRQIHQFPSGYYNLGVAHGVPGIVQFLGEVAAAGIQTARARRLLDGAVRWLLAQEGPPDVPWRYGWVFLPGMPRSSSRLAWCYGDLGIGAVLYQAGARMGRRDWQNEALALLDHSLAQTPENSGVKDPPLCHGALGAAHIYNRIAQATQWARYREAALYWYDQGLKLRQAPGIGGFFAWWPDPPKTLSDPSLLSGAIGSALALVSAAYPVEPWWDRLLLLSGRDREGW